MQSRKQCWGMHEMMYIINQLCNSVMHPFNSNIMNVTWRTWFRFKKKEKKRTALNYCGARAIRKGFPASPSSCLEWTWRLVFSRFSAYVTCNINLNDNWTVLSSLLPSPPLPSQPLWGVKGLLICVPIVPNTSVGVPKPFSLDRCWMATLWAVNKGIF